MDGWWRQSGLTLGLPRYRGQARHGGAAVIVIPRRTGESVVINDDIILTVIEIRGDKVRFQIECPREATVHRKEVYEAMQGVE
jgi:carbon storage regulator